MKPYIAVMQATADNRVAKYQDFNTQAEAQDHVDIHIINYPSAFVHSKPSDAISEWLIDMVLKTIIIDVPVIIPPTDEERIDAAFPQTDVARVLFEVIWTFANEIEALKTGAVFDPDNPILTREQVKTKLKNLLP